MKEDMKEELHERDWLYSLVLINGIGRRTLWQIYNMLGSFSALATDCTEKIEQLPFIPQAVRQRLQAAYGVQQVRQDKQDRLQAGQSFICFLDEEFPQVLREIPDAPLLLFYSGKLTCLKQPMIGVVGSRKPTPYGKAACAHLTKQLAEAGFTVVSGLAYGIDAEAHKTALRTEKQTIGVMGCGIDQIYPPMHRSLYEEISRTGLLLSEYPPGTVPLPNLFPERNRIISGLSLGVLVIEAAERSGSLITADFALEQGRDVFAVPGSIFSSVSAGPHNLIKQGAKLVTSCEDIIVEFTHQLPEITQSPSKEPTIILSEGEKLLVELLSFEPSHWNELYQVLQPAERNQLDRNLIGLETKGVIASLPGGFYVLRTNGK